MARFSSPFVASVLLLVVLSPSALAQVAKKAAAPTAGATAPAPDAAVANAPAVAADAPAVVADAPAVVADAPAAAQGTKTKTTQSVSGNAVCPLTGKAPAKPDTPLTRCQTGSDLACCTACQDANLALDIIAKNGSSILGFVGLVKDPSLAPFISAFSGTLNKKDLCSLFKGNDKCLNMIEALTCGMSCSADAGNYLKVDSKANSGDLSVCGAFATQLYAQCSTLLIPGINAPLSNYMDTPDSLFSMIVAPLIKATTSLDNLTVTIDNSTVQQVVPTCFSAPAVYPTTTVCCDPLTSVDSQCFASGDVPSSLQDLVGRTLPSYCPAPPATSGNSTSSTKPKGASAAKGISLFTTLATAFLGMAAVLSL